jgi:hypothetical protein
MLEMVAKIALLRHALCTSTTARVFRRRTCSANTLCSYFDLVKIQSVTSSFIMCNIGVDQPAPRDAY